MIKINGVSIVKSGRRLFQDFSLAIKPGEHYLVTGKNGSGKTMLLELIAGLVHPIKGNIEYDFITKNTWEDQYWERKKKIQFIPTHAIQQFLNNANELYYQQRYYGGEESKRLVKDILNLENEEVLRELKIPETLNITHLLHVDVSRLSNGQLKKVLLLQSLLKDKPKVLLLDYPFEGLDVDSRKDLSNFIDFIATEYSIQIILVDHTHHLPAVINRTLVLEDFRIIDNYAGIPNNVEALSTHCGSLEGKETSLPTVVEMKDLKIQYGNTTIIKNFNWLVRKGERWALIGRNGSGKTTIFSLIFADHPMAYSQQVYLFGKRRGTGESIWDIKKRMSYLGPELINYLNPKNISISARQHIKNTNKKIDIQKLEELVSYFEAENFIDIPVKSLSSGQLQLMLVMNSFIEEKELLLLDEPFQFLDSKQKKLMKEYLQAHLHRNITLIMITHYDADIEAWTAQTKRIG